MLEKAMRTNIGPRSVCARGATAIERGLMQEVGLVREEVGEQGDQEGNICLNEKMAGGQELQLKKAMVAQILVQHQAQAEDD